MTWLPRMVMHQSFATRATCSSETRGAAQPEIKTAASNANASLSGRIIDVLLRAQLLPAIGPAHSCRPCRNDYRRELHAALHAVGKQTALHSSQRAVN